MQTPVRRVAERVEAARSARGLVLVGIGGHGGAGKSTFAGRLAELVTDTQVVPTDAFWDGRQFDLVRLRHDVVDRVLEGAHTSYTPWDWRAGTHGEDTITIEPTGVVVIEGVCALHEMFRYDLDVRVWVDAPSDVRLARGIARDGEAARSTWTDVWMPNEDAYVARDRPVECAHLVVDGTRPFG